MSDPLWQRIETLERWIESIDTSLNYFTWIVGVSLLVSALALISAWWGA